MKCIPKYEQEYLACLERNAEDTRRLFSNEGRIERERMVVRAFLRCIGESFVDGEIRVGQREPVDIVFREATFQIKMMLGGSSTRCCMAGSTTALSKCERPQRPQTSCSSTLDPSYTDIVRGCC